MEQASITYMSSSDVRLIPLTPDTFLIGRGLNNSLVVEDMNVSRTHCILERRNGEWWISDRSSNGTWVNNKLVDKSKDQLLRDGDSVWLTERCSFVYNKTSHETEGKPSSSIDSAETEIAEAEALVDADIFNIINNRNVTSIQSNSNKAISSNESANSHHQPVVNIVQTAVPDQLAIAQLLKLVVAPEQSKPAVQAPSIVNQQPECSSNQDPSCSKDDSSAAKAPKNHLEQMEDEVQCSICTEMFVKAVTLSCAHTFCKFCIAQWQKNKNFCPICRAEITMQFPTLVIDSFIDKIVEGASEEVKQHRRDLIAEREALAAASTSANATTSNATSFATRSVEDPIEIGSSDEETNEDDGSDEFDVDDLDGFDEDDTMDYSESNSEIYDPDDNDLEDYNGVPGCYYGGYGRCYACGQRGHWANGCPNRRKR